KWVAVDRIEVLHRHGMPGGDRQQAKAGRLEGPQGLVGGKGQGIGALAPKRPLDGNFPQAGGADRHAVERIGDQVPRLGGQFGVRGDGPQRHMGIEEEVHSPSNIRRISSLSASKSSGTSNRPLAMPMRRLTSCSGGAMGTSRAAGRPLRAMTISASAPLST